jgi:predicted phage terminase large subunit-like protein
VLPTLTQVRAERTRRAIEQSRADCRSLAEFSRQAWHVLEPSAPYVHGWHIDAICAHLEAVTWGRLLDLGMDNRLLFNVPPGFMKSLLVSVFWPAWEWGPCDKPWTRYLSTSYSIDYVRRDSRRMRDLVSSEWYQERWGDKVKMERQGEASFSNTATGFREGVPFGSLTAGRADRLIIDDPHSTETAESDSDRARTTRIFRESVPSRINDARTSAIVVIMQRLHSDDVAGIALKLGLGYVHVMLPMEFEPERRCDTPFYTDPRSVEGELLFPERFPREVVERDKKVLTQYAIAAQYQQRPAPREGGMFNRGWFEVVPAAPVAKAVVRGWDLAATKASVATSVSGPAYTAGVRLSAALDGTFYVEHVTRARGSPSEVEALIRNTASQDGQGVRISVPQDPGQAGKAQVSAYAKLLVGYDARFSPESGDKASRALPVSAQAEVGNVKLVRGGWNEEFLAELALFPGGSYKDQVDALSRAFAELLVMLRRPDDTVPGPIQVGAHARMRV